VGTTWARSGVAGPPLSDSNQTSAPVTPSDANKWLFDHLPSRDFLVKQMHELGAKADLPERGPLDEEEVQKLRDTVIQLRQKLRQIEQLAEREQENE